MSKTIAQLVVLDVHIGSTLRIARFWGLAPPSAVSTLAAEVLPAD